MVSSNKRAVLVLLVGTTVLFLANVAIAHKTFSTEEEEAAAKLAQEVSENATLSELEKDIAEK